MRRILALSLLVFAACKGEGARLLAGFGEAMVIVSLLGVVVLAVVSAVYVWIWVRLLRALRRARESETARGAFWLALAATICHVGLIALLSEHEFGRGSAAWFALFAGVVPVGLLLWMAWLTARRGGGRWPVAVGLGAGVGWLVLAEQAWQTRLLAELPGRIVQLSAVNLHACARLSTGQVACLGANWQGQRGDGSEHAATGPTLVRGISDATGLVVAGDLGCALRERGPAVCWGGDQRLPVPGSRLVPWALPGGEDAAAIVASEREIVVLARDGTLRGWPEPPPAGLTRALQLYGDEDFDGGWFCALEEAGALACWSPRWPEKLRRIEMAPPVAAAVDADARVVCAADAGGTVRCVDLEGGSTRTRELPGLRELVAADDDGTFCALLAGGEVLCWRGGEPTRELPELVGAQLVFGGGGFVCGEIGAQRRCVAPGDEPSDDAAGLLAHDRAP